MDAAMHGLHGTIPTADASEAMPLLGLAHGTTSNVVQNPNDRFDDTVKYAFQNYKKI